MIYCFTISGRLDNLNDFISANNKNRYIGNEMKQKNQRIVEAEIMRRKRKLSGISTPVVIHYKFYEPNSRRDLDNISAFAHKVIQDALVAQHIIPNDGWKHISGYSDAFYVDKDNPRIEVFIEEVT